MREIKFRALTLDSLDSWVYGFPIIHSDNRAFMCVWSDEAQMYVAVVPKTLGQFIGSYDKNAMELYEGDIVKTPKGRDIVDLSRFRLWLQKEDFGYEGEELISPQDCEIIGNIHENPELVS